jgi:glycosyltransferase involved in cell wall biosynthesis
MREANRRVHAREPTELFYQRGAYENRIYLSTSCSSKEWQEVRVLCFFLNRYAYGEFLRGAERRFFEVSKQLKNLGVDLFALEYESFQSEKWGAHGYTPIKVRLRFPKHPVLSMLRVILLGWLFSLKYRIDIVYVSCRYAYGNGLREGLIAPYLTSCLCRKPLVIVFHHLIRQDFSERNPITLRAYQKATCLAVSESTANAVRKHFQVRDVAVVGNGIRPSLFKEDVHRAKKYMGVFVGIVTEEKGIFVLLKAWKAVVERSPNARLLLIGGVHEQVRSKLHQTVRDLGLEKNVTNRGFVPDSEMVNLLNSSEIYIHPSLYEGFAMSVAEAMATGLPCILSDIPALREVYSSAAMFVPPSDADSLAEAILTLTRNPTRRKELGRKGKELASEFSWEKVADKEYEAMKTLTGSRIKSGQQTPSSVDDGKNLAIVVDEGKKVIQ